MRNKSQLRSSGQELCYIEVVEEIPFKATRRGLKLSDTMGRTSKFSFPLPGRKHNSAKDKTPAKSSSGASNSHSKAQRLLGTDNELNIDSPIRDDDVHSWRFQSDRSDGMSISVSESTHSIRSTNESGSIHGSPSEQWDHESGVFPRPQRLRGKASSTLLGQHYGEDGATDTSSVSRIRREDSSSTLKSYYDRQKSPLSISQQTSASSARDLALRKGFPQVIPRSPLLQVEPSVDPFEAHFGENYPKVPEINYHGDSSRDKGSRKKPARLDLSMLFPRSRKNSKTEPEAMVLSPSSTVANAPHTPGVQDSNSNRRRLQKAPSKESLQSQKYSIRSNQSKDSRQRQTGDTLYHLYDHYEHLPVRSPHMSRIPESRVPNSMTDRMESNGNARMQPGKDKHSRDQPQPKSSRNPESALSPADEESFSWKHVRQSIASPPWELSSAASVSSRNTKTSRHTSTSVFSNSDLKQKSVLSLSSDSEGEASDLEPIKSPKDLSNNSSSRNHNGTPQKSENRRQSTQQPAKSQPGLTSRGHGSKKSAAQSSPFLTIPETSSVSARLSGPWSPPKIEVDDADKHLNDRRRSSQKEKRSSKKPLSISSKRSSQQPTPPLSPTSVEFREVSERSSRFMAVTKQEEALLSALRQKRARMREEIITEHETAKSPPHSSNRSTSRFSEASSVSTLRGNAGSNGKGQILLYLDTPISNGHPIDTAEPSPDLSDFLSFGSDEDSTPRTSWAPQRKGEGEARPDSSVSPDPRGSKFSPRTPPSAARLSAVGAIGGLRDERSIDQGLLAKKRNTAGVRFVDDGKLVNAQDFLLDENETEVIWGM